MKLRFAGLTAGYTEVPAVRDVTFEVCSGDFVALVGPNGSGKSTLLKTVYRALRPRNGHLVLGDGDLWRMPHREVARAVGVLGQEQASGYDFTAREAVALGRSPHLGAFDRMRAMDEDIVDNALVRTGSSAFADRPLSTLSGGERQRVLLARALAQQPRILVLDELTNHLDPEHQIAALSLVRSLGITVLTALHSLDLAAQYATAVVVLHHGRVVCAGRPDEVLVPETFRKVFNVDGSLVSDPVTRESRVLLRELDKGITGLDHITLIQPVDHFDEATCVLRSGATDRRLPRLRRR